MNARDCVTCAPDRIDENVNESGLSAWDVPGLCPSFSETQTPDQATVVAAHAVSEQPGVSPDGPNPQGRDDRGRFTRGNVAAVTHALRASDASELPPALQHLMAEIDAWMGAVLADEGNLEQLSARRRALLENRGRIQRRIVQLDAALELRGLIDRRGKLRVAWLQRLEGLVNQARALDALLGLARRSAPAMTIGDILNNPGAPEEGATHAGTDDDAR